MKLKKTDEEKQAQHELKLQVAARQQEARAEEQQQRDRERAEKRAVRDARSARARATTLLAAFGVAVYDGQVYAHSLAVTTGRDGRLLGQLAGAQAEVTGGRAGHRRSGAARTADTLAATAVLGPFGLLAAASRKGTKGTAFIVFADGSTHERQLQDAQAITRAQADAVRFNALANSATRQADHSQWEPEAAPDVPSSPRFSESAPVSSTGPRLTMCLDCINAGCDKTMVGNVGWTRLAAECGCRSHH